MIYPQKFPTWKVFFTVGYICSRGNSFSRGKIASFFCVFWSDNFPTSLCTVFWFFCTPPFYDILSKRVENHLILWNKFLGMRIMIFIATENKADGIGFVHCFSFFCFFRFFFDFLPVSAFRFAGVSLISTFSLLLYGPRFFFSSMIAESRP